MHMSLHANHLLARLAPEDFALLEPHFESVELEQGQALETAFTTVEKVYFPEAGVLSVIASLPESRDIEVGIIGREGMSGVGVVLNDEKASFNTLVQLPGPAKAIYANIFSDLVFANPGMMRTFGRFARALMIQIASTALANGRAKLESRLARWLVMVQDRTGSDRIPLTHEYLSIMLGVRRAGVTDTLHILEGKGFVRSNRGEIVIRERQGLIDLADGAYGLPEEEYQRLIGF